MKTEKRTDEAIKILSRHLMQCGMLMPIEWVQRNGEGSEFMKAYEMAMDALKNEPVRCKECKHWIHMENGFGDCTNGRFHLDGHADPTMNADDFCSCGERRADSIEK